MLAKALRDPAMGHEYEGGSGKANQLSNTELRYRQRYVDLFVNKDAREILVKRIKVVRAIREFLDADDFLEVETPVLQTRRWRRRGASVPDPPQFARNRPASSDQPGALPEAADRWRVGPRL